MELFWVLVLLVAIFWPDEPRQKNPTDDEWDYWKNLP